MDGAATGGLTPEPPLVVCAYAQQTGTGRCVYLLILLYYGSDAQR